MGKSRISPPFCSRSIVQHHMPRGWIHFRDYRTTSVLAKNESKLNPNSHLFADPYKKEVIDSMIRVDHAGEFGAQRIYEGQMAILGKTKVGPVIKVIICSMNSQI
jgi:demethoxyubiquinone hydroxylase (CLK1/Coq7/Cat5 family)